MKKNIIVIFMTLLLIQPVQALTVYDPWNFSQNIRTAIQSILDEINQLRQLQNQYEDLKLKGSSTQIEQLANNINYIDLMQGHNQRIYGDLQDIEKFNQGMLVEYNASGLSREEWLAAENDLYEQGYDLQRVRVQRATEWNRRLDDSLAARRQLQAENQQLTGAVSALQVNNELLEQVIGHLDVLVENTIAEEQEQTKEETEQLKKDKDVSEEREKALKEKQEELKEIKALSEYLGKKAREKRPLFDFGE